MLVRVLLAVAPAMSVGALMPTVADASRTPLRLHPDNPRYFLFRGKPIVLIGSGEHYGAVLNLDFNYAKYLDELGRAKLNHTRTFSGVYCEPAGAFAITKNTLAPLAGRYLTPWARSDKPGYANGGNLFDLARFDSAYFARLKGFLSHASKRGVVVEMNLFCPFYEDAMWRLSPMNAANNVNNVGRVKRTDVYTLDSNGGLLPFMEGLVRRIVRELNGFDNLYYEVCNEPYFGGVTMAWQHRIVDVIQETERSLPMRHLVSLNIANGSAKVEGPHPGVSILNFHYASPPDAVATNYGLGLAIGDNETGFRGTADTPYRREAWEFILAGGALFSHLDYSFVAGGEDGTYAYPATQPGGGNPAFRRQMRVLREFVQSLDFVRMRPDTTAIANAPSGVSVRALSRPGEEYAVYLFGKGPDRLSMALPAGAYRGWWIDTLSGGATPLQLNHTGGEAVLQMPEYREDIALHIVRRREARR